MITHVNMPHGDGECVIKGRTYHWTYDEWLGPLFLKNDGAELKRQPGPRNPVWKQFEMWEMGYYCGECRIDRLKKRVQQLEDAIRKTLDENRHLADGENCTLIELKKALPEWT